MREGRARTGRIGRQEEDGQQLLERLTVRGQRRVRTVQLQRR